MSRRRDEHHSPMTCPRATMMLIGLALGACSTTAKIASTPAADVRILTPTYAVKENLGQSPVDVKASESNLDRFMFSRKGASPEYLLVLYPDKVDGTITAALGGQSQRVDTKVFSSYFDTLLRAHRLMLKADFEGAKTLLAKLDDQHEIGFGSAVIQANIAVLEGRVEQAARFFEIANGLVPGTKDVTSFTAKREGNP